MVTWHVAMKPGKRNALPNKWAGETIERIKLTKTSMLAKVG